MRNSENTGFAKANNRGIAIAKGRYILLLNSDTLLREGTIETLITFIDEHPKAAAVGPKVLNSDGTLQFKGFSFPSVLSSLIILFGVGKILPAKKMCRLFPKLYWDENAITQIDFVPGCCLLMRKDVIDAIGPLPEEFFMYFEEAEWCFRAKKNSYEVWYVPSAEIIHFGSASPLEKRRDMFTKSMILFYKRNIGVMKGIPIAFFLLLATVIAFFRVLVKPQNPAEHALIKQQLKQQLDLLKGLIRDG